MADTESLVELPALPPVPAGLSLRRRASNAAAWGFCLLALALIVAPAVWVLAGVIVKAAPDWHWSVLTTNGTQLSRSLPAGGLEGAILGTLLIMAGVALLAGTVGILAGIHLAEHTSAKAGGLLRGSSEVLAGIPSIALGYVGYLALVVGLHWGYSLGAALIVLSIMVVPYVTRSTESALRQVPTSYREGAEALGMTPSYTLRRIVLRSALPGITTGLLVALAIAVGETAPLLYTAGYTNALPSLALTHQGVPYLTYAIWTFFDLPSSASVSLSYDAALLLVVLVVVLIVGARLIVALTQRNAETAGGR